MENKYYALTKAQKGLWFEYKLNPKTNNCNAYIIHKIEGTLDIHKFLNAQEQVANHFYVARVKFQKSAEEEVLQYVLPKVDNFYCYIDLTKKSQENCAIKKPINILKEVAERPFNLEGTSCFKTALIKEAENVFYYLVLQHHIVADAFSLDVYLRALSASYNQVKKTLKKQYPQKTVMEYLTDPTNSLPKEKTKEYWNKRLKNAEIHFDFGNKNQNGDIEQEKKRFVLGKDIYGRIKCLAIVCKTTPFLVLMSIMKTLLYRYWNKKDISVGYNLNTRPKECKDVIGYFVKVLPLRTRLREDMIFLELINEITKNRNLDSIYGDISYSEIIKEHRGLNVLMGQTGFELNSLQLKGTTSEIKGFYGGAMNWDLEFSYNSFSKDLPFLLSYNSRKFSIDFIERMINNFRILTNSILDMPNKKIFELDLLTKKEKQILLSDWNCAEYKYPNNNSVHGLFEEKVENNKDRIAVVYREQQLTYEALNEKANQLGYYLKRNQVTTEMLVGISIPRGLELIIGLLGILKSGGAYVPLDPEYPKDRLRYMLEDAGIKVLLTTTELKKQFKGYKGKTLYLDKKEYLKESTVSFNTKTLPGNLAYVVYTSGSTGKPKGINVLHYNITDLLTCSNGLFGINNNDVILQGSNVSFDAATFEIWGALLHGALCHIVAKKIVLNSKMFASFLYEKYITKLFITTALFNKIVLSESSAFFGVRDLYFGGEEVNADVVKVLMDDKKSKNINIYHMYGPTECTTFSTYHKISIALQCNKTIPIGRPIPGYCCYILDNYLNPVPIGTQGEIYIGGAGLARGYLNRPSLTAEKFILNPFVVAEEVKDNGNEQIKKGSRLYKTGDLGRYLEDGNIEFLGRIDHQVKIRGFRVELGEIESTIQDVEGVKQCVVLAREDTENQKRLVGYIVLKENSEGRNLIERCRKICKSKLPDYMQLSQIMVLENLPLTPNGKIDRQALPKPEGREGLNKYEEPIGLLEEQLASIWKEILKIEKIGRDDNFFSLGGDSIVSIQMVSRARQKGIIFDVKQVFETPTVAGLTINVQKAEKAAIIDQSLTIGIAPLLPIQQWFFEKAEDVNYFNQATWIIPKERKINVNKLKDILAKIYSHHDTLRLKFRKVNNEWEQYYAKWTNVKEELPFEIITQGYWFQDNLDEICTKIQASLDIESGPLSKLVWFEGKGLFWVIHHLIVDGVSWRILLEDLNCLYKDRPLALKSHSYQAWGEFLQRYDKLKATFEYYKKAPEMKLPLVESTESHNYVITFSKKITKDFIQKAQKAYRTQANDLLLTALVQAIGKYTNYQLCIDLEGHGREVLDSNLDLTKTIGWFTSIYPVFLKLSEPINLDQSIKEVKEQVRQIPEKGITYGIASYIKKQIPRVLANIAFNYLGQWDTTEIEGNTFKLCNDHIGRRFSKNNKLSHNIVISGKIEGGILSFVWTSSYQTLIIKEIVSSFKEKLENLINHCSNEEVYGYTPSDFALVRLNQDKLDTIFHKPLETIYPLSPIQGGLLFQALYHPESDAYFVQKIFELDNLNTSYWYNAWYTVVNRYDSLKASFVWGELDEAVQIIHNKVEIPWLEEDWSDQANCGKKLQEVIQSERRKIFDLNKAPLMRFNLIKNRDNSYYFIWNIHHLLIDGWCIPIILGDVLKVYRSLINNVELKLKARRPYRDYISWLLKQDKDKAKKYWEKYLAGAIPTRLSDKKFTGNSGYGECILNLNTEETNLLNNYAKSLEVTANTVLQGIWSIFLSKYTRQEDIVFGVTVSGRNIDLLDVEDMVGIFINTLPIKIQFKPDETIKEFLKRLQTQMSEVQKYGYIPLATIQTLQKERNLFDSIYGFENYSLPEEEENNSRLSIKPIQGLERTEYKISMIVIPGGKLKIILNYDKRYFVQGNINKIYNRLKQLISHTIQDTYQYIGDVSLPLDKAELIQLSKWNNNYHEYPKDKCIHELFEEVVETNKDRVAVVYEDRQLTYEVLNEKANQLGHYLKKNQVKPETLVGISVPKSLDLITGLLGILKSGGGYVPLDPELPKDRLNYILGDAKIKILLTTTKLKELFKEYKGKVIHLNKKEYLKEPIVNLNTKMSSDNLAYIIYTSGSTGRPKGTAIFHRALVNRLKWQQKEYGLKPQDVILHKSSIGFDVSIWELLWSYIVGAKLVVAALNTQNDIDRLCLYIKQQQITTTHFVPALLNIFSSHECNMKFVICSGEVLTRETYNEFSKKNKGIELYNLYGPTETTIDVTYYTCRQGKMLGSMPIGIPIYNIQIHILDKYLNQVPIGITGEIYIGGVGLARGYLNRPSLTAEKFIPDPFVEDKENEESRLYRTGDLGRYMVGGNIEFLGRIDYQVKIRGFRIELGELEILLTQHAKVKDVVVMLREDHLYDKRLVAYLVLKKDRQGQALGSDELRSFLKIKVPDYMIPAEFIFLDILPLTLSGKIDRKALPVPDMKRSREKDFVAPRSHIEKKLAQTWVEVLGIQKVGIFDNFFEMGGHSLLAVVLIAKINQRFFVNLSLTTLFQNPTIAVFAKLLLHGIATAEQTPISQAIAEATNQPSDIIKTRPRLNQNLPQIIPDPTLLYEPFPLTDLQQSYHLGELNIFPLGNTIAHSFTEIEFNKFNKNRFIVAFQKLIEIHSILRGYILPNGKWQILKEIPEFKPTMVFYEGLSKIEKQKKLDYYRKLQRRNGPTTSEWPLFKVTIHIIDFQKVILHLNFCLALFDGFSSGLFFKDLIELYNNSESGIPVQELSYRDYIIGIAKLKESEQYQLSKEYWLKRLNLLPESPQLPLVKNVLDISKSNLKNYSVEINQTQWKKIKQLAVKNNITASITVYCAFAKMLALWSQSSHFSINVLYYNRFPIHEDVNKIIGNFSSTILSEIKIFKNEPFIEFCKRMFNQQLKDIEHAFFSGVEVLRELNQRGKRLSIGMPVVFTSALDSTNIDIETALSAKINFINIQTPQVYYDYAVFEMNGKLKINLAVQNELFPDRMINDMLNTNIKILSKLAENAENWINPLLLNPPNTDMDLIQSVNKTDSTISDKYLHTLFFEQVQKNPNNIAIVSFDIRLSYLELYQIANYYAEQIRKIGVKPNTLVAVIMKKGWEQIVAILAIITAGAAYVPIDVSFPKARINKLLELGKVNLALTQEKINNQIGCLGNVKQITVSTEHKNENIKNLTYNQSPNDLAYVIFTSGSTGEPKGVMIDHKGAINTILDINTRFQINEKDKILAISEFNFDLSVWDIFGSLAAGAILVIPNSDETKDPRALAKWIRQEKITIWNSVPAFIQIYQEYISEICPDSEEYRTLRLVMMSGDWIPLDLPNKLREKFKNIQLISMGGATEASVWSIIYYINKVDRNWKSIPYGKPMVNQKVYVLNDLLESCPIGVINELYIGGIGVALGYWQQEDLTNERFIRHPVTNERLYKTGDLGKLLPDGNIELLGRRDNQVKIQGYRIECGEIENAIMNYEGIKNSIVSAKEFTKGEKQLVAYLVLDNNNHIKKLINKREEEEFFEKVKVSLADIFPSYMIPKYFVRISCLPLSANGKVDINALPNPLQSVNLNSEMIKPRNEIEQKILEIWKDVLALDTDNISITDNFFDLGGHSISAVRLLSKINNIFKKEFPVSILIQIGTVEELAKLVIHEAELEEMSSLIPMQRNGDKTPFFCVHPVGGHVMCYQELAKRLGKDRPFFGLQSNGLDGKSSLLETVEEMAKNYIIHIKNEQKQGPYYIGGWSFGGLIAFEIAIQLIANGETIGKIILIDTWIPKYEFFLLDRNGLFKLYVNDLQKQIGFKSLKIKDTTIAKKLDVLFNELIKQSVLPINLDRAQFKNFYKVYEKNMKALLSYQPKHIKQKIELIKASELLKEFEKYKDNIDNTYGWDSYAKVNTHTCKGNHYSMFREQNIEELTNMINKCLNSY
jgi:amino acid adenylation domain-containing protein/non-ribosomal peptide synthase protein (TIGR01720 family)